VPSRLIALIAAVIAAGIAYQVQVHNGGWVLTTAAGGGSCFGYQWVLGCLYGAYARLPRR
jgi:hypothetical protein